jgi:hypothetical protein
MVTLYLNRHKRSVIFKEVVRSSRLSLSASKITVNDRHAIEEFRISGEERSLTVKSDDVVISEDHISEIGIGIEALPYILMDVVAVPSGVVHL